MSCWNRTLSPSGLDNTLLVANSFAITIQRHNQAIKNEIQLQKTRKQGIYILFGWRRIGRSAEVCYVLITSGFVGSGCATVHSHPEPEDNLTCLVYDPVRLSFLLRV